MHSIKKISDEKIVDLLTQSVERENRQLAQTLSLLSEVMDRRIHLALGYASLFEFCSAKLCLSEGAVYRRTQVAGKIKGYPLLYRAIKESNINLTVASAICPHLAKAACPDEFIRRFFGKTKRQAEVMLIDIKGAVPVPRDEIRPVGKRVDAVRLAQTNRELGEPLATTANISANDASPECENHFPEPTETVHKISFAVGEKFLCKLAAAKDLLSHKVPDGALERIFEAALDQFLKANSSPPRAQTNSPKSSEGRYIPRAMAFEVRKRSGDRCEFLGAAGRCLATKFLVIDHIRPLSKAGKTEAGNLQILCTAHNHFKAEKDHGRCFIGAKTNRQKGQHRG